MVRQGPIPAWVHGILEYLLAFALIASQFVLGFQSGEAKAVALIAGVGVLVVTATTNWSTSIVDQLPVAVHVLLDYVLAGVLIASPFLFGFSSEPTATYFFLAVGILHLLVTIGTRFFKEKPAAASLPPAATEEGLPAEPAAGSPSPGGSKRT